MTTIKRPARQCSNSGCRNPIKPGHSQCAHCHEHAQRQRDKWHNESHKAYHTPGYQRARTITLKRYPDCVLDHLTGCRGPMQCHHLNGDNTDNQLANLITLCTHHHLALEAGSERGQRYARELAKVHTALTPTGAKTRDAGESDDD